MYNEQNTRWPINMLIKTGGGDPKTGQTAGIHWHMNIGVKVEYIARDKHRQDIPWLRVMDLRTGRVTVYQDSDNPLSEEEVRNAEVRIMDCMDCHNRPSHIFRSPDFAVDLTILTDRIDYTIPEIKRVAVESMIPEYTSEDEALKEIANHITSFYRGEYPEIYNERREVIERAILATQEAFSQSIFPEMGVRWSEYPDNIGHFISPGCMRCHAGNHVSEDGLTITRDCNTCHAILSQGSGERAQVSTSQEGLRFEHPEDIDEAWTEMGCYECHDGTQP
jgi:ribosomal protein S27E